MIIPPRATRDSRILTSEELKDVTIADLQGQPDRRRNEYHGDDGERPKPPQPEISIVCVDSIKRESVKWLWPGRVPLGKLTLMCGDPGKGKSHVTMCVSARTSVGAAWPDGEPGVDPGSVVIFSAEDDPSDTIRPRLERAGADLSKCFVLESVKVFDHKSQEMRHAAFNLEEHVPLLEAWVEKIGDVKLIVIDPISSYTGKTDSHKNAEVRAMLMALVSLAERHGIAILAVTHLNKTAGGKAVYRATGSLAFAAAARSVVMITEDLDDPRRRLLLPVKCNIAAEQTGLAFTIQSDPGGSYVAWDADPVKMTADGYLQEEAKRQTRGNDDDDSALADAVKFLKEQLAAGPVLTKELSAAAKEFGIRWRTVERAVNNLGVKSRKEPNGWVKHLPDWTPPSEVRQIPYVQNVGGVGGVDGLDQSEPDPNFAKTANAAKKTDVREVAEMAGGDAIPDYSKGWQ